MVSSLAINSGFLARLPIAVTLKLFMHLLLDLSGVVHMAVDESLGTRELAMRNRIGTVSAESRAAVHGCHGLALWCIVCAHFFPEPGSWPANRARTKTARSRNGSI